MIKLHYDSWFYPLAFSGFGELDLAQTPSPPPSPRWGEGGGEGAFFPPAARQA